MNGEAGWLVTCPDYTSAHRTKDAAKRQAEAMDASHRCWHTDHLVVEAES